MKKIIWFKEDGLKKAHACRGMDAEKTFCGIMRATRKIHRSEMLKRFGGESMCKKCSRIILAKHPIATGE